MRLVILGAVALLTACAGPRRPATEFSNYDICRITMSGGSDAAIAQHEANRRGLDCLPYYQAINAQKAREAAAFEDAARYFNPAPIPRQSINCDTSRIGTGWYSTNCR